MTQRILVQAFLMAGLAVGTLAAETPAVADGPRWRGPDGSGMGVDSGQQEAPELDVLYMPSHPKAVEAMLKLAAVTNTDYLVDLGCGDGRIVIAAAKTCGARGLGVDLDPERVAESQRNAAAAGVADRVEFRKADMATTDLRQATVVTLFLSAEANLRLRPKLLAELKPGARVVSNSADMGDWKPDVVEENADAHDGMLFLWTITAPVAGSIPAREAVAATVNRERSAETELVGAQTPWRVFLRMGPMWAAKTASWSTAAILRRWTSPRPSS